MESGPNLPSSSPVLALVLIIVMAAMLIASSKWLMMDIPEEKQIPEDAQKLVGRWEQTMKERTIDMDLEDDGYFRYALRDSDRLNLHGTWKIEEGRLVLHVDKVHAGSTFSVGDHFNLGPVLSVEGRTLILGTQEENVTFRRRR